MIGISLLAVTMTSAFVSVAVLCVVANRPAIGFQPSCETGFGLVGVSDPTGDTLNGFNEQATLACGWQEVQLDSLADVEDLLDALEARNIRHREMTVVSNDQFVVRWR